MSEYAMVQTVLEKRAVELNNRLQKIKQDLTRGHARDWSDQAQERENDEVLNQLGHDTEREIHEVNAALSRLQNDSYGICVECGESISSARLKIKPETALCTDCAHRR